MLTTIAGITLFAAIFTAYQRFYSTFGLQPEDVGVNYPFILSRSVAFGLLIVIVSIAVAALPFGIEKVNGPWRAILPMLGWSVFAAIVAYGSMRLTLVNNPPPAGSQRADDVVVWAAMGLFAGWLAILIVWTRIRLTGRPGRAKERRLRGGLMAASLLICLTVSLNLTAARMATLVENGHSVGPLHLFGLPLVDVSASSALVQWIGPPEQAPAGVLPDTSPLCVRIIGQNASMVFWTTGGMVVRMPAENVAVTEVAC
ncbi:hypothetical protein [Geodermatophilus sp. SYSU D01036]